MPLTTHRHETPHEFVHALELAQSLTALTMSRSRSIASATDSGNSGTAAQGDDNIQDDPDWQDGDFTLISSDGWRLKAWSYHLFSARYASPATA